METRARLIVSLLALVLAALSLGPSYVHLLEAQPRLEIWSPELWRETTVFNGQFRLFAIVGAPVEMATLLVTAIHRSEEHTSELQSLMRISYAVFCLKKKKQTKTKH